MTRHLPASILIDPPTAAVIRATVPREVCRVRRLALVRPLGFSSPIEVSELLPPLPLSPSPPLPLSHSPPLPLSDESITAYESALDAFLARNWQLAVQHLGALPGNDPARNFLTRFITLHGGTSPPEFDGSISLEGK
jgi:hypothetical protein